MKSNTLRFAILLFIFSISTRVSASHLVGVDFEYQSIDSNRYIITCNVYRDCGSAST
ncbi:MAG: hypothetical protein IPP51_15410 [Bacteroidetes bacterium]|nr:hypothetical protein [Bacteroidota bacterium]